MNVTMQLSSILSVQDRTEVLIQHLLSSSEKLATYESRWFWWYVYSFHNK